MRWPWVSRALYDAMHERLNADLDRERKRVRLMGRRLRAMEQRAQKAAHAVPEQQQLPAAVEKAIRETAGTDRAMTRHLRVFALDQMAAEIPEHTIAKLIRVGAEVPN